MSSYITSEPSPYETFELLIGQHNGIGYPLTIVQAPAGDASALCTLDPTDPELQDALGALVAGNTDIDFLTEIGDSLFDSLFRGAIESCYRASLSIVRAQEASLRIRLRIEPPELAALPWEYMHDFQEGNFLAISAETAVVRYIPVGFSSPHPAKIELPLRILVVISNPHDAPDLNVEQEKAIIQEALSEWNANGQVALKVVEWATVSEINQAMRSFQPHVFHFIGHGAFEQEKSWILLEDEVENGHLIDECLFREFFSNSQETRLVVLNACQSATTSSSKPLAGLAPQLLQKKLPAVVAMQAPITDSAAQIFAREFYRSLALGHPVDEAVSEARKGIFMEGCRQSPDWGVPVLFLRARTGQLFAFEQTVQNGLEIPPPPEPIHPPLVKHLVGRDDELAYFDQKLKEVNLALINGMTGAGKSSLAATLAQRFPEQKKVFWHTFHKGEGLENILWKAAGFLAWNGKEEMWNMLQSAQMTGADLPPQEMLFEYLFQAARGENFLICLDDYHYIKDDMLIEKLAGRLETALATGTLSAIITSECSPHFINPDEFKPLTGLTRDAVEELLIRHCISLTHEQIDLLYQYTEGSPVFVTLALDSLERGVSANRLLGQMVSVENIERYLISQVHKQLTQEERQVMAAVSLFQGHDCTSDLIEYILEKDNLHSVILNLRQLYLLDIRDSADRRAYRQNTIVRHYYYHLVLNRRGRRQMHLRAAQYYAHEELNELKAAIHYECAGAYSQAADLAKGYYQTAINRGEVHLLRQLYKRFDAQKISSTQWAAINIGLGRLAWFTQSFDAAETAFEVALSTLSRCEPSSAVCEMQARANRFMGELFKAKSPKEALNRARRGLQALADFALPEEVAALHLLEGHALTTMGNYTSALYALEAGLALTPDKPDPLRIQALMNMGRIYGVQGDMLQCKAYTEQALHISQQLHDHFTTAQLWNNLGVTQRQTGDWAAALMSYQEALELAEKSGNQLDQIHLMSNLGMIYKNIGDEEKAIDYLLRTLALARKDGDRHQHILFSQCNLADLYLRLGEWQESVLSLNEAEQLALAMDYKALQPQIYTFWTLLHLAQGQSRLALERSAAAVRLAHELEEPSAQGASSTLWAATQWLRKAQWGSADI